MSQIEKQQTGAENSVEPASGPQQQKGMPYKPEYCFKIIESMAAGYTLSAAAALIGAERREVHKWINQHPEFAEAVKRGETARALELETTLLRPRTSSEVRAYILMLERAGFFEVNDAVENPLQALARQLKGKVMRPQEFIEGKGWVPARDA